MASVECVHANVLQEINNRLLQSITASGSTLKVLGILFIPFN